MARAAAAGASLAALPVHGQSAAVRFPQTPRSREAVARNAPRLQSLLARQRLRLGSPVFLRVLKEEARLEVFIEGADRAFRRFRAYDICSAGLSPGPKLASGDGITPEGFYAIDRDHLRPGSSDYLALSLGYPGPLDPKDSAPPDLMRLHGGCSSDDGSIAMTDPAIEEIYTLVEMALRGGQSAVPVHIFPFTMRRNRIVREADPTTAARWGDLMRAWIVFQDTKRPPRVGTRGGRHVIVPA